MVASVALVEVSKRSVCLGIRGVTTITQGSPHLCC